LIDILKEKHSEQVEGDIKKNHAIAIEN